MTAAANLPEAVECGCGVAIPPDVEACDLCLACPDCTPRNMCLACLDDHLYSQAKDER